MRCRSNQQLHLPASWLWKQFFSSHMYDRLDHRSPSLFLVSYLIDFTELLLFELATDNLTEALMFLSHFMGDIHQVLGFPKTRLPMDGHKCTYSISRNTPSSKSIVMPCYVQPLHVGFTSDRGGNTIDVHWYTRKQVLHHVCELHTR